MMVRSNHQHRQRFEPTYLTCKMDGQHILPQLAVVSVTYTLTHCLAC
jgi:hypothetical protein